MIKLGIVYPFTVFLVWRLIILLFQIFIQPYYKITGDSFTIWQRIFTSWTTYWDSGHYISISQYGYQNPQQVFFPLWPLFIKVFSFLIPPQVSVYILSFIFGLTTFILFFSLAKRLLGLESAKLSLIFFCAFPSTMFIHAGYTESLFLTIVLLSFLFLERKLYLQASLMAGLSSMTKLVGIATAFSCLLIQQPISKKIIYFLIAISGLAFYMLYLKLYYSDPLYFFHAQANWCSSQGRCGLNFPLKPIIDYAQLIIIGWVKPSLSSTFIDWFSAVAFLFGSLAVLKFLGPRYFIYSILVIIPSLFSGITVGMVRYTLVAFPVFFVIPNLIKSRLLFFTIVIVLFLLQLRFVALFTSRIWVA